MCFLPPVATASAVVCTRRWSSRRRSASRAADSFTARERPNVRYQITPVTTKRTAPVSGTIPIWVRSFAEGDQGEVDQRKYEELEGRREFGEFEERDEHDEGEEHDTGDGNTGNWPPGSSTNRGKLTGRERIPGHRERVAG